MGRSERWMIVRRSRSILGGLRVVKAGLTEDQAKAWAAEYKRPHEAISEADLLVIRQAAIKKAGF